MANIYYPQNSRILQRNTISSSYYEEVIGVLPNVVFFFNSGSQLDWISSSVFSLTASMAVSASYASNGGGNSDTSSYSETSSYSSNSISASYALTSSYSLNGGGNSDTASYSETSSYSFETISSSYALTASYSLNGGGNSDTASYARTASYIDTPITASTKLNAALVLLAGFTPYSIGPDYAEIPVPYNPLDGFSSINWNIRRVDFRVSIAGGAPYITLEKSTVSSSFSASAITDVYLQTGSYETSSILTGQTLTSGNKLRINISNLGTAIGWNIVTLLNET